MLRQIARGIYSILFYFETGDALSVNKTRPGIIPYVNVIAVPASHLSQCENLCPANEICVDLFGDVLPFQNAPAPKRTKASTIPAITRRTVISVSRVIVSPPGGTTFSYRPRTTRTGSQF